MQNTVRSAPLKWLVAGIVLGLCQILAVALSDPLGVSTQFVIVDTKIIQSISPQYVQDHPLVSADKYQSFGYGWWLDIGLLIGAFVAAIAVRRWRIRGSTVWSHVNGHSLGVRFLLCFIGGFLVLLGARFAGGCTSGQFISGWTQLSLSAVPFTIGMFVAGMITARIIYPKTPRIDK
ncbi:MAG: YeeE/YedE family protein [Sedimentisphaerales bacterium]|nr:YeeE/YedE family protein [Sedimentisphaerales bacterium]